MNNILNNFKISISDKVNIFSMESKYIIFKRLHDLE
jgi:hypothetical protein